MALRAATPRPPSVNVNVERGEERKKKVREENEHRRGEICCKAGCRCSCSRRANSDFLLSKVRAANRQDPRWGTDGRIVKSSAEGPVLSVLLSCTSGAVETDFRFLYIG